MTDSHSMEMPVLWGAYYTYRDPETGTFSVFRLLDLNKDAIHYALFSETFKTRPEGKTIARLKPFAGHIPQALGAVFNKSDLEISLSAPLNDDALGGYRHYLGEHGMPDDAIDDMFENLKQYSRQPPLRLRLTRDGDDLQVSTVGT